ncbi:MAG: branched-chain amino acid ABC transporter permease [Thermodesulfobacteriota bacterium]
MEKLRIPSFIKNSWYLVWLIPLFVFLPFLTPHHSLASEMLIFAIFAMGYDILFGYTGLLSFGHAIFFGVGAYSLGLILIKLHAPLLVGLLGGIFVSLVIALVVGFLSIRVKGIYFVMVTLAFCQMFYFIAFKWAGFTGGDNGLHGVPRPPVVTIHLDSEIRLYYFILILFVVCLLLALRVVHSPFGRALQSLKSNEDRAKSIGFDTSRFKLISFLISAFFGGLAGGLYALHLNFVPLETLHIMTSGDVVIMSIIGGIGTLYGPIFGAMLLVYLKNLMSGWTEQWNFIMGILFITSVLTLRRGILVEVKERFFRKG